MHPRRYARFASCTRKISVNLLSLSQSPPHISIQIHLDEVVLEIVAEAGAGNLLGNLLCAVTSLLDGGAALAAIAELLNNIIDLIGTLP